MRESRPVLARNETPQVPLDLDRILLPGEPEPLRESAYVGVHNDPLRRPALRGDDVSRLPPDSGQSHEVLDPERHLAAELFEQHRHRASQVPGLLPEGACRPQVPLELFERDREVVLGTLVLAKEALGDTVHGHVRRLGGEHDRDEELEIVSEPKGDRRVRVLAGQTLDDRPDPESLRAHASPRLSDVTSHGHLHG